MAQGPLQVPPQDAGLLFTAAQLWHALPADIFVKCLGSNVESKELNALVAARTPVGVPQPCALSPDCSTVLLEDLNALFTAWLVSPRSRSESSVVAHMPGS